MAAADSAPKPAPITEPPKVAAPTAPAPRTDSPIAKAAPPVIAPAVATATSASPGAISLPKLNPLPPLAASLAIRCWF